MKYVLRTSINGFYCAKCGKFNYQGVDHRDSDKIEKGKAYCISCFEEGDEK